MEKKLKGYKCLLCGDVIYRRTRWDDGPQCRCGNIYFIDHNSFDCIVKDKYKEIEVELGEGVDNNILERDEAELSGEYGRIESNINEEELEKIKTKVLLLEK